MEIPKAPLPANPTVPNGGVPAPANNIPQSDIVLEIGSNDNNVSAQDAAQNTKGPKTLKDITNAIDDWLINQSSVSIDEKLAFFQMLASMINAGVSVTESLSLLGEQNPNKKFKRIINDIKLMIEDGENLAHAMERATDIFDKATCSIIAAGEKSGKLNEVLKELVSQFEKMQKMQKKVQSVMMYPMIVMVVMVLLVIVVVVFVVPKLEGLFGGKEGLPLPTRILIGMSDFVIQNPLLLIGGAIGIVVGFKMILKSPKGSKIWSNLILALPVAGALNKSFILSRVTRIFGFLIASGVPIIESLRITANVASNPVYKDRLLLASDDLGRGISIAENLSDDEKYFPKMLVNMIAIGERTAGLENIMEKIANFYDEELDRKIGNLSKLMEPFILAIIAAGAVFMIMAIYLPILQLNETVVA